MKFGIRIAFEFSSSALLLAGGAALAQSPTTERVSVDTAGAQGNSDSSSPSVSADGSLVAFESSASNLVAGDTNARGDVFVRERLSGTTTRVSVNTGGVQGSYPVSSYGAGQASISSDGRFVAFAADFANLVLGDTNWCRDVFVRDVSLRATSRVSVDSAGAQSNGWSGSPSISADGRFIAFASEATNLVASDTNGFLDVFVRDGQTGMVELVSVATGGAQANFHCGNPSLSADGRFVAFQSLCTNLVAGDANGVNDVFVRDRLNGTTERVSVDTNASEGNDQSDNVVISADGRFVAFNSLAPNLVTGDTNGRLDVFVRDRQLGTTERVSVDSAGSQAQGPNTSSSFRPAISLDGRFVAFVSRAWNLVPGDTNTTEDVFVRDRQLGATQRVNVSSAGVEANIGGWGPSVSADGRFVAFATFASNLVAGDTNAACDVFLRDRVGVPAAYCTSSTSSNGCSASILANAQPSVTLTNSCNITVTSVEGSRSGILFYGISNSGFTPGPWASGSTSLLCVKHPTQRTPIQNSGGTFGACDGSFALDWNAYQFAHPLALGNPWSAGDKVYVQAWFRDPLAAKATNLSNALELTYVP